MTGNRESPSRFPVFCVIGNCVPYDTKASGGRRTPRKGKWLLAQPRSGASVRQAHTFYPSPGAGENPFGRGPPARRWLKQNSTGRRGCQSPFFAAGTFGGCGGRALAEADSDRWSGRAGRGGRPVFYGSRAGGKGNRFAGAWLGASGPGGVFRKISKRFL